MRKSTFTCLNMHFHVNMGANQLFEDFMNTSSLPLNGLGKKVAYEALPYPVVTG